MIMILPVSTYSLITHKSSLPAIKYANMSNFISFMTFFLADMLINLHFPLK